MPGLAQMFSLANGKSSYSRQPEEVYAALDKSGFKVYTSVLKENSGFFVKFDTSSVTLVPGTVEYALPPDLTQIVHVGERLSSTERFRTVDPEGIGDSLEQARGAVGWGLYAGNYGGRSQFRFAGPYLDAAATAGVQTQKIRFSPHATQTHMVELAYTAKWMPILNASSIVMLPEEGTHAMLDGAIAELLRSNDDSLSAEYAAESRAGETAFLTWVRNRQIQKKPSIRPYLG